MTNQILFVQGGGGERAHDEWDNKLVEILEGEFSPTVWRTTQGTILRSVVYGSVRFN